MSTIWQKMHTTKPQSSTAKAAKSHRLAAEHHAKGDHKSGLEHSDKAHERSTTAHEHSTQAHEKSKASKWLWLSPAKANNKLPSGADIKLIVDLRVARGVCRPSPGSSSVSEIGMADF